MLAPILRTILALGALGAGSGYFLAGPRWATGIALGAALATANLWAFGWLSAALLGVSGRHRALHLLGLAKVGVLFGLTVAALWSHLVDAIALFIGYLTLPVGITVGHLLFSKPGLDDDEDSA